MDSYNPLFYPSLNMASTAVNPPGVHTSDDATTLYYQRMLYQRAMSVIEWHTPDNWDNSFLQYCLSRFGYAVVLDGSQYSRDNVQFGIVPQWGTLYGYGIYYQPIKATVATPLIYGAELEIGKDCELIRMTPDYMGIYDIIHTYAELLAQANMAASMSLINSKVAWVLAANNKASADTLKMLLSKIYRGEPAVIVDKNLKSNGADTEPWAAFTRNVGESYISDRALADFATILGQFDEEIGIPSLRGATASKKERVTNEEVHRNDMATSARLAVWADCLERSVARVNALFGDQLLSPISFEIRKEEVEQDADENQLDGNE